MIRKGRITEKAFMTELAKFKFDFDGNVFGTQEEAGEPEKIREEPFDKLEVDSLAKGEGEEDKADEIGALTTCWNRFRQSDLKWEFGAKSICSPDCPAKVEVYLCLTDEFVRSLCQVLPKPALSVEGSLELGMKTTNGPWSKFRLDSVELKGSYELFKPAEESGPLPPWKFGSIPIQFFHGIEHEMRLRLCVKIRLDWGPTTNFLQIEDSDVVQLLPRRGAKKNVTIVGECGKEVKCHWEVLSHYGNHISRFLSPTRKRPWMERHWLIRMSEVEEETAQLLVNLIYGKAVPTDGIRCEIALQLLQVAHKYEIPKVKAAMAALIGEMDDPCFSTDGSLKLFFFLQRVEKETVGKDVEDKERNDTESEDKERNDTESEDKERNDTESEDKERNDTESEDKERNDTESEDKERNDTESEDKEVEDKERNDTEVEDKERNDTEVEDKERNDTEVEDIGVEDTEGEGKEREVKAYKRLTEKVVTVLAKTTKITMQKSEVYQNLALNEKDDLHRKCEEMREMGMVEVSPPIDESSQVHNLSGETNLVEFP